MVLNLQILLPELVARFGVLTALSIWTALLSIMTLYDLVDELEAGGSSKTHLLNPRRS